MLGLDHCGIGYWRDWWLRKGYNDWMSIRRVLKDSQRNSSKYMMFLYVVNSLETFVNLSRRSEHFENTFETQIGIPNNFSLQTASGISVLYLCRRHSSRVPRGLVFYSPPRAGGNYCEAWLVIGRGNFHGITASPGPMRVGRPECILAIVIFDEI
jgi:hypothetical protein